MWVDFGLILEIKIENRYLADYVELIDGRSHLFIIMVEEIHMRNTDEAI